VYRWKEHVIQQGLYRVDIEPRAIELCRLRYWLSLLVDLPAGIEPHPLPNLEYRTVVVNSLVDFAGGVEIQNTRGDLAEPFQYCVLVQQSICTGVVPRHLRWRMWWSALLGGHEARGEARSDRRSHLHGLRFELGEWGP
jgi:hypothetical protein